MASGLFLAHSSSCDTCFAVASRVGDEESPCRRDEEWPGKRGSRFRVIIWFLGSHITPNYAVLRYSCVMSVSRSGGHGID